MLGDKTGAVTGRQRVMNAKQQGDKGEGFVAEMLRHVQRCDFELSFASTVGAFTAVGALPVLPGRPDGLIDVIQLLDSFLFLFLLLIDMTRCLILFFFLSFFFSFVLFFFHSFFLSFFFFS